jgi:hypothetical protein
MLLGQVERRKLEKQLIVPSAQELGHSLARWIADIALQHVGFSTARCDKIGALIRGCTGYMPSIR